MTGTTSTFRLGDWLIEPAVNRVSRDEEAHHLEAKAMDVLVYLIEHAGKVVPTEALLAHVWPGRIVEQSTAHHRINQIRKVLGDDARSPEYIQTIPKRGYRLIAPVAVIAAPAGELEQNRQRKPLMATRLALGSGAFVVAALAIVTALMWAPDFSSWFSSVTPSTDPTSGQPTGPAIAVLPFVNASDDPHQEYFSDGVAEDILNALAKNQGLVVRPRSSTFRFKGSTEDSQSIGRLLNVSHVLEGSLRSSGETIRVTVNLVSVNDNRSVWSESYNKRLADVFDVQDSIVSGILSALHRRFPQITEPMRRFDDVEAYKALLLGRHHFNRFEPGSAIKWFERAAQINGSSAEVWAGLAHANLLQSVRELRPNGGEHLRLRGEYVDRSLRLDPRNAEALMTQAITNAVQPRGDYRRGIDQLVRLAIDNPNDEGVLGYLAIMLYAVDRPELSKRVIVRQAKLAPRSPLPWANMVQHELLYGSVAGLRRLLDQGARMGFVVTTYSGQLAIAERDSAALESVITDAVMPPTGPELVFPALKAYLDGEFERAAELVKPLKKPRGYQSYLQKWRIALVEQDLDAAMEAYRMAILNAEPLAITLKHGLLGYRTLFPEFYEHPQYEAMLSDFGLDARSLADIRIPSLSF